MKNIVLKITLAVFFMTTLVSCTEDETALPTTTVTISNEDFQTAVNSTDLDIASWTNFNETGAWKWREKTFSGNGYAEFSAFRKEPGAKKIADGKVAKFNKVDDYNDVLDARVASIMSLRNK